MIMLQIVAEAVGFTLASLFAAVLFNWCSWHLFKLFGRPEWGPPVGLIILLGAAGGRGVGSEFLRRTIGLAILASVVLWATTLDRRRRPAIKPVAKNPANSLPSNGGAPGGRVIYPAIAACLGEGRAPSRAEIRKVAKRIRREAYSDRPLGTSLRRAITRAALAALGIPQSPRMNRDQSADQLSSTENIGM